MQKKGTNRKTLVIGIVAVVAILAVLLVLLTQCTGGGTEVTTTPTGTVETTEPPVLTYNLYWNADRAEYDGKSEAGLSSRQPEADGYFHIRFILDGEEVILKTNNRKLVNEIDVRTLMDLVLDENGFIIDVIDILDMPVQRLGWMFFVQSTAKDLIKLNSADNMNGIEVLLELTEKTAVYDMSGETGPLGTKAEAMNMDRVYALGNMAGEVTHVFIYERSNYMLSHEAECQHCEKTVTWYEWTKEDQMPTAPGHYQLQNDVKVSKQPKQEEDAKVCLDLNGHRVDATDGVRCYAMFNAGTELAIMDTSEGQTGVMASHGTGAEGMVVWVRYGVFYLYGGTLDGSDTVSQGNGVTVATGRNTYFYMHGGKLIGGVAEPRQKEDGSWTAGLGGTLTVAGKFVMNDGEIRGGRTKAVITARDESGTPTGFSRGMGGNIMMGGGSEMIMNGGLITGGYSGSNGGNIYMDSGASLTINDGIIRLGNAKGNGRSGGNIYVGTKATVTMNGGMILSGTAYAVGGNIRCKGTFTMNGGYIADGRVRDWATGEKVENSPGANIRIQDGYMYMYGGRINGGVNIVDTSNKDSITAKLRLGGLCIIDGGEENARNLTLGSGGDGVNVKVKKLHKDSRVGVYATTGYFTEPTEETNENGVFFSDIEGAEVIYHDGRLALGALGCVCGSQTHFGECDGTAYLWSPWLTATSLPKATGYWYLTSDLNELPRQTNVTNAEPQQVYLNLNGHSATVPTGTGRVYRVNGENRLVITDHVGTGGLYTKGMSGDSGAVIFQQDKTSRVQLYGGTLAMTADPVTDTKQGAIIKTSGTFDMFGGTISGGVAQDGANVYLSSGSTMNMSGGEVKGGTNASGSTGSNSNIFVLNATFNMSGGTVYGIRATNTVENGCAVNISGSARILTGKGGHALRMTVTDPLTTEQRPMVNVGQMNEDGIITISGISGFVTDATDPGNVRYFASSSNEQISYLDGRVYIGRQACVCGTTTEEHISYTVDGVTYGCDGTELTWKSASSLPTATGNYCLSGDVTVSGAATLSGAVVLDLNGHTVTVTSDRMYTMTGGASLTITNSNPDKGGIVVAAAEGKTLSTGAVAQVAGGTTLNLYNTKVTMADGSSVTGNGGLFEVSGTMHIYGSTKLSGGKATGNGGNVAVDKHGVLNLFDGTVTKGNAVNGGNIGAESGTVNIYGGTVTAGTATNGGNFFNSKSTLNARAVTISGGSCTGHGNNIYTTGSASKVYLTGTTVKNTVSNNEDNITYRAGVLEIKNATLTSVDDDYNIYCQDTGANKAILLNNATVTGGGIYLTADKTVAIGGKVNGPVSVKYASAITEPVAFAAGSGYTLTYEARSWFTGDGCRIAFMDGKLCLVAEDAHVHCICGGTLTDGETFADGTRHTCEDVIFQALSVDGDDNIMTQDNWLTNYTAADASYWYLTESIRMETGKQMGNNNHDLYLCLHGHSITGASDGRRLFSLSGGELVATTCKTSGSNALISTGSRNHNGSIVQMNGTEVLFEAYGVTLDASGFTLKDDGKHGAAIDAAKGTVKLYDTTVKGGVNQAGKTSNGSVMRITANCDVFLYGGSIIGNQKINDGDVDIWLQNGAALYLVGDVSITSKEGRASILTEGTAVLDVTHLTSVATPVRVEAPGVFTRGWSSEKTIAQYFASAVSGSIVALDTDSGELALVAES